MIPRVVRGPGGVAGVVALGGGEVDRPGAAQRADGEVPEAGHDVGAGAGAQVGAVLGEGGVAEVVSRRRWCRPFSIAQCPRR
jgi:hypothetical protein